ncbi:MAG: hypothetical protein HY903_09935 [Deltaproteobacteria bacterium]|nr:hypothetical protein [Deltaproteobacteria bacterium]
MSLRHLFIALTTAALVTAVAACDGGDSGAALGRPEPPAVGRPIGEATTTEITPAGGVLTLADGSLAIDVPAGALGVTTELSIQPIGNYAPGAVGAAYRLGPEGLTFAVPVTLTFSATAVGRDAAALSLSYQRASGYWVRAPDVRSDAVAKTVSVDTAHFSDWTLVVPPVPTANDITGPFALVQTVDIPFSATGDATFFFQGGNADVTWYVVGGTISVPATIAWGASTCVPDSPMQSLADSVAEVKTATAELRWGVNARWDLTCTDPGGGTTREVMATYFDSLGVSLWRCARSWVGTPVCGPDFAGAAYLVDCGADGTVDASWTFSGAACGQACSPADPCKVGVHDCATGTATCQITGNAPDGTDCGGGLICTAGVCG